MVYAYCPIVLLAVVGRNGAPWLPLMQLLSLGKSFFLSPKPTPTSQLHPEKAGSICRPRDYIDLQCWYPGGCGRFSLIPGAPSTAIFS